MNRLRRFSVYGCADTVILAETQSLRMEYRGELDDDIVTAEVWRDDTAGESVILVSTHIDARYSGDPRGHDLFVELKPEPKYTYTVASDEGNEQNT